jgi:hypothetical protein
MGQDTEAMMRRDQIEAGVEYERVHWGRRQRVRFPAVPPEQARPGAKSWSHYSGKAETVSRPRRGEYQAEVWTGDEHGWQPLVTSLRDLTRRWDDPTAVADRGHEQAAASLAAGVTRLLVALGLTLEAGKDGDDWQHAEARVIGGHATRYGRQAVTIEIDAAAFVRVLEPLVAEHDDAVADQRAG